MWLLRLNNMQNHTEDATIVAWAETKEALEAFIARERVEPYDDGGENTFSGSTCAWRKSFRKGGPLQWFNPLETSYGAPAFSNVGTLEDHLKKCEANEIARWTEFQSSIMQV